MNLGDFSSLVQLGVGIHAGTAILQLLVEFKTSPLIRRIRRTENYLNELKNTAMTEIDIESVSDRILIARGKLDVFSVGYFNEYSKLVIANFAIAVLLLAVLILISFNFNYDIGWISASILSFFCFGPAALFYIILYSRSKKAMLPIIRDIEHVEVALNLRGSRLPITDAP